MCLMCVLLHVQMVRSYAGGDSTIEAAVGERFVLMGGNVLGEFTQLVRNCISLFFVAFEQ